MANNEKQPSRTSGSREPVNRGFALSHVGAVRRRNEDAVWVEPDGSFAVLADGMGGHRGGQEASQLAIRLMRKHLTRWLRAVPKSRPPIESFLKEKFIDTSAMIFEEGQRNKELIHMGATLMCWLDIGGRVAIAHVGDSRAYLFRDQQLFQMTPDHTLENEQIISGKKRAEIEHLPIKHVLSRNVGMMPATEPDVLLVESQKDDLWLLCSDGLTNKLSAQQILWHFKKNATDLPRLTRQLVEQAFASGGEDNISVCLMQREPETPQSRETVRSPA